MPGGFGEYLECLRAELSFEIVDVFWWSAGGANVEAIVGNLERGPALTVRGRP